MAARDLSDAQRSALRLHIHAHPGISQRDASEWFFQRFNRKISQGTVSKLLSAKYAYLDGIYDLDNRGTRNRNGRWPQLDEKIKQYIGTLEQEGRPISDVDLLLKAREYWEEIKTEGASEPQFSYGWMQRIKLRMGLIPSKEDLFSPPLDKLGADGKPISLSTPEADDSSRPLEERAASMASVNASKPYADLSQSENDVLMGKFDGDPTTPMSSNGIATSALTEVDLQEMDIPLDNLKALEFLELLTRDSMKKNAPGQVLRCLSISKRFYWEALKRGG